MPYNFKIQYILFTVLFFLQRSFARLKMNQAKVIELLEQCRNSPSAGLDRTTFRNTHLDQNCDLEPNYLFLQQLLCNRELNCQMYTISRTFRDVENQNRIFFASILHSQTLISITLYMALLINHCQNVK